MKLVQDTTLTELSNMRFCQLAARLSFALLPAGAFH